MSNRNIYLASKPRYEILDGLRGVAAMLVAYGAYRLYDLPVREWLKKKLFKSAIKREESDARINYPKREQARPKVKSAAK